MAKCLVAIKPEPYFLRSPVPYFDAVDWVAHAAWSVSEKSTFVTPGLTWSTSGEIVGLKQKFHAVVDTSVHMIRVVWMTIDASAVM